MTHPAGMPAVPRPASATGSAEKPATEEPAALARPARTSALVAAGLAVVIYLLGFADDLALAVLGWVLSVGGGFLAGAAALPRSGRILVPAAVAAVLGALLLLQDVVGASSVSTVLVISTVLAFLLAVAAVVATLLATGLVTPPQARPRGYAAPGYGGYGPPPGYGYGQQGYPAPPGYGAGYGQPGPYGAAPQAPGYGPADPTVTYPGGVPYGHAPAAPTPRSETAAAPTAPPAAGGAAGTPMAAAPTGGDWYARPDTSAHASTWGAAATAPDVPPAGSGDATYVPSARTRGATEGPAGVTSGPEGTALYPPVDEAAAADSPDAAQDSGTGGDDSEKTEFIVPADRPSQPS